MLARLLCVGILCSCCCLDAIAQTPASLQLPKRQDVIRQKYLGLYAPPVVLSRLVHVKMKSADVKPQLILMLNAYENQTRKVKKTTSRIEQRTRTIIVDGIEKEQIHSVAVPVTTVRDTVVRASVGLRPKTVGANKFTFFDLSGKPVSIAEASKRLEELTPVFLLDNFHDEVEALSEVQQQALNPKCLIVTSKDRIRDPGPAAYLPHY